jgi:hypothetical protein
VKASHNLFIEIRLKIRRLIDSTLACAILQDQAKRLFFFNLLLMSNVSRYLDIHFKLVSFNELKNMCMPVPVDARSKA